MALENSFHGRTLGALSTTGQPKLRDGFEPLLPRIKLAKFNDLDSAAQVVDQAKTCAILVEPIQGEGGVYPASRAYLSGLGKLARGKNVLLIFDEIQCDMGRTGKFCAHEWDDVEPNMMAMAKPLVLGLPLGALLVTDSVASCMKSGSHGSTFGGGPLVTAVANYVIDRILGSGFLDLVRDNGSLLLENLQNLQAKHACIAEIRGRGLMVGVKVTLNATELIKKCAEVGLLFVKAGDRTMRFLPSLTVAKDEIEQAVEKFDHVLK